MHYRTNNIHARIRRLIPVSSMNFKFLICIIYSSFLGVTCVIGTEEKLIDCEIFGLVDFDRGMLWFTSTSKNQLLISLTGSVLDVDHLLDYNEDEVCLRPYNVQQGNQWLMAIPKGKPSVWRYIRIENFSKTKFFYERDGFIEVSAPIFKLSDEKVLSGPYILRKRIRVVIAKPGDIDESKMFLIPVD